MRGLSFGGYHIGSNDDGTGGSNAGEVSLMQFTVRTERWMDRGLCRDDGRPDLWFPDVKSERSAVIAFKDAVKICARCPVQVECLQFALDHQEMEGMWGGLTPAERVRLLVQRAADEAGGLGVEDLRGVLHRLGRIDSPHREYCERGHPLVSGEGCKTCAMLQRKYRIEAMTPEERAEDIRLRRNAARQKRRELRKTPQQKAYERLWTLWKQGVRNQEAGRRVTPGQQQVLDQLAAGQTLKGLAEVGWRVTLTEEQEKKRRTRAQKANAKYKARTTGRKALLEGRQLTEKQRAALTEAGELGESDG
jgi:WhiB family redox-sensing transcriptional regulator